MTRNFHKLFFLIVSILSFSYAFNQTANITAGCAPVNITFTAPASASTYFWDFKDGASSTQQNPTNTFTKAGTYKVEFKASASGAVVGTIEINVYDKPVPTLSSTSALQGCAPLQINLQANVTLPAGVTVSNYNWAMGEGSGLSGKNINNFTYANPGIYDLSLSIITNYPSCDNTTTFDDYIKTSNPIVSFSTSPDPAFSCTAPLAVTFSNTSTSMLPLTYSWDFGNGSTNATATPPTQNYTKDGQFNAKLTITDSYTCSKSITKTVSVGKPKTEFTVVDSVCMNQYINLKNNSSAGIYSWTFDTGTSIPSTADQNPAIYFYTPGLHTIKLKTTSFNGACFSEATKTVFVEDPVVTLKSSPTYSCSEPVSIKYTLNTTSKISVWDWKFGDTTRSNKANPTHIYDLKDTTYAKRGIKYYTTTLYYTTSSGCKDSISTVDTIDLVNARFLPDIISGCSPLTVNFSDSTYSSKKLVSWLYDFGDGVKTTFNDSGNKSHTFNNPGIYPVVLKSTNASGCFDISDTVYIQVGTPLPLNFTMDKTAICIGEEVKITNTSANQGLFQAWNVSTDGELLSACYDEKNPSFKFNDTTGTFDVTLSAFYNGCLSTITKANSLQVKGPRAKFTYQYDCAKPLDLVLKDRSNDATTLSWELGDTKTETISSFTHTYAKSGDYFIKLTATNPSTGCPASIDTATIHIRQIKALFNIDSTYCGLTPTPFDASKSTDVYANCHTGYEWFFSDENIRPKITTEPTAQLAFQKSGKQTLGLVVNDINGCKDSLVYTVNVFNLETKLTVSDTRICLPDTLKFTNQSTADTTIVSWSWDFGDNNKSTLKEPTNIYKNNLPDSITSITATLTTTDILGCKRSASETISLYRPISNIISPSNPFNVCTGDNVQFAATDFTAEGSNLTFNWNYKDGTARNTAISNVHKFQKEGTYNVSVVYREVATGCIDSTITTVNVQNYPTANFSSDVDNFTALCNPQIINFTNTSTGNVVNQTWNFSNGITASNSTATITFEKGKYDIELIATSSFGCNDTLTKHITVLGPSGDFTISKNNICQGDSIRFALKDTLDVGAFTWDFGDGKFANDINNIYHPYYFTPPSGQTVAKLTLFADGGLCPVTVEKPIFIYYVKSLFDRNDELDTAICLGESISFTNKSIDGNSFIWNFGDNQTSNSSATNISHLYNVSDTFDIKLITLNAQFGCSDTLVKQVIVHTPPKVEAISDTVCLGNPFQLSIKNYSPSNTYTWHPGKLVSDSTIYNPTANLQASQDFIVDVLDAATNCKNSDTASFFVIQPLTNLIFDTTIVVGDIISLPISNQNNFVLFAWTPEIGLSCKNCSYPSVQPLEEITYEVQMSDVLGCSTGKGVFHIKLFPQTFVDLPTTFTPNEDGTNDVIFVKGWGIKDLVYFQIFNKWGEMVFETSELSEGWDGYYKGNLQNNDTYTYKVKVMTWLDKEIDKEGFINLMR